MIFGIVVAVVVRKERKDITAQSGKDGRGHTVFGGDGSFGLGFSGGGGFSGGFSGGGGGFGGGGASGSW